ncbi:unnamed protein product [Gordionus sp. m RMFG-2023]
MIFAINLECQLISKDEVVKAVKDGVKYYNDLEREWSRGTYDLVVEAPHLTGYYRPPTNRFVKYSKYAIIKEYASLQIAEKLIQLNYSPQEITRYLERVDVSGTFLDSCPLRKEIANRGSCPIYYRTIEGHCNNLKHPTWGMAELPPQRLLPAVYNDGVSEIRRAKNGGELPNARMISTLCLPTQFLPHTELTVMMTTFGQLIDHDLTLFPVPTGFKYPRLKCCLDEKKHNPKDRESRKKMHPYCYGLNLPVDDPFYSYYGVRCMEAVRSLPGVGLSCNLGVREQVNQLSNYIDASTVYGNTIKEAENVRLYQNGLLKTQRHPFDPSKKDLMPLSNGTVIEECLIQSVRKHPCFMAGEMRSNENLPLTTIHTIFFREHNRLVREMSIINPDWNDDKLFEEVRRIVGAMMQYIAYKEYLPKFFGEQNLVKHKLVLADSGYFNGYDENEDATTINAFSSAAFRFSHSLLNANIFRVGHFNYHLSTTPLRKLFFQPESLYGDIYPHGIDPLLRGSTSQLAQALDINIAVDVKNHLFQPEDLDYGMDLMSLNIIRARDNGIAPYNDWREYCGMDRLDSWDDAYDYFYPEAVSNMSYVYGDVDDIDLWIGGISEMPMEGALIGPTFSCIVGIQFRKLRFGDRFWFENEYIPGVVEYPFTPEQLQEIRKSSLAKVICHNTDTFFNIQKDVFLTPGFRNPMMSCRTIGDIDLTYWKDN